MKNSLIYFFTSVCVTFFLFFIDEGYYDLRWMETLSNWFFFFAYAALFFCGQFIAYIFFRKMQAGSLRNIFVCTTGLVIGFIFAMAIFTGWLYRVTQWVTNL